MMSREEEIEKAVRTAYDNNRLEGLVMDDCELDMIRRCLRGEATFQEFEAWAAAHAGVQL